MAVRHFSLARKMANCYKSGMDTLKTNQVANLFGIAVQDVADAVRRHGLGLKGTRGRARDLDEFDAVHLGAFVHMRNWMLPGGAARVAAELSDFVRKNPECDFVVVEREDGIWLGASQDRTLEEVVVSLRSHASVLVLNVRGMRDRFCERAKEEKRREAREGKR
ncbi:MAG: hypothetical protein VX871_12695 [Pseudomonadota bacterium]|nr:hypothetical protein [Pseudomonadota bacterium]